MKLTVVLTNCVQTGIDQWTNAKVTRVIELSEEQKKQIVIENGWCIHDVILEL